MRPKKIWVLFGGNSSEREVSLRSGKGITEALKAKGFDVLGFDVTPGEKLLSLDWAHPPEIVYLGLHGAFGEDGTVQGFLDSIKVPYVGSGVLSSALCFHKGLAKKQMQSFGVPMPFSYDVRGEKGFHDLEKSGTLPKDFFARNWFIKPAREGSTIGIERFRGQDLKPTETKKIFLEMFSKSLNFDQDILIEEWIEGPELTVPLFEGKALPIVEIRPLSHFYDYESKYTKGKTEYICPAPLKDGERLACAQAAEKAFVALGCSDYGRVDIMLSQNGPRVLEMNTLPGMTETSLVPKSAAAAGMDYATFLEKLVLASFARQKGGEH